MPGTLVLVPTPIGNLDDITLRALRVLREADVIAAEDTRRTAKLLTHFGITTSTLSLHDHNERHRIPGLVKRIGAGQTVAVVTDAGTPTVSDPGFALVRATLDAGLRVEALPGASALTVALAGSGLPAEMATFVGFPPSRTGARARWLGALKEIPGTLVLFEAPQRLRATLQAIRNELGNRPAVVAHELTKVHESWHRGPVGTLATDPTLPEKGEFTLVLGPSSESSDGAGAIHAAMPAEIGVEFGQMIETADLSRREVIAELARRHRLPKKQIYAMVEAAKNSGK